MSDVGLTGLNDALPLVSDDNVWTKLDPLPHVDVADEYNLAV